MKIASRINIILATALMCLCAASCKKDTTIQYYNVTMGNVDGSTFVSDQGNIFNVVEHEDNTYEELLKTKRAYILCDVLNKTVGGQDNEYDVRLNDMVEVLDKDIVTLEDEKTEEIIKEDPILYIENCWFSGGYINFYIKFLIKSGSQTPHMINLIQQESEKDYLFRLTHNAAGETLENIPSNQLIAAGGYVSFPINKLIKENEAEVNVEYTRYKTYGAGISTETELKTIEGIYVKGGFEQPSGNTPSKTIAVIR